jgi:hypothetical protein
MKQTLRSISIMILMALFVACETTAPAPLIGTATPSPTPTISSTPSLVPASLTPTPLLPSPTLTFPPVILSAAPEGLRMAYVVDGNIYVQNGGNAPVQLTYNEDNAGLVFSEDGERLIFRHNPEPFTYNIRDLSSIHTDGTQRMLLVTGSLLERFGWGYNEFTEIAYWAYVPGTQQVLFRTIQLNEEISPYREGAQPNLDLLSVNIDTGEIKVLLPPGKGGNFVVSPDGSMIAVQATGHIDVVGINGWMIRQNLVTYTPSQPYELVPDMFWTEDSTGLIVALPVDTVYEVRRDTCTTDAGARSVWRYAMDGSAPTQISLDPLPIGKESDAYGISPDRNWMFYQHYDHPYCPTAQTDETITPGRYLVNLQEGTAQWYSPNSVPFWSPDSIHFLYDIYEQGMFLGSINEPPVSIDYRASSLGWIDARHYLAYYIVDGSVLGAVGEIDGETIYFPIGVPVFVLEGTARKYIFSFIYLDH